MHLIRKQSDKGRYTAGYTKILLNSFLFSNDDARNDNFRIILQIVTTKYIEIINTIVQV